MWSARRQTIFNVTMKMPENDFEEMNSGLNSNPFLSLPKGSSFNHH